MNLFQQYIKKNQIKINVEIQVILFFFFKILMEIKFLKEFNIIIKGILELNNNNLVIYSDKIIHILKYPNYEICLTIQKKDFQLIYSICEYKSNYLIISFKTIILMIKLNDNFEYEIISSCNIPFICYKIFTLNNRNKILCNFFNSFSIMEIINNKSMQLNYIFKCKYSYYSILQVNKNEIVCSSYFEKCIRFIDIKFGTIISIINNIDLSLNEEIFCIVNKNILCVGGDLRSGIYFIDIDNHILLNQYKKNYLGYTILLSLENKKFLGETFSGRYYGESDDENEDLLCTQIYEYDSENIKPILIKDGTDRNLMEKRSKIIKLKKENKIAFFVRKILYISNY